MDQSSIYLDCPSSYCYSPKGAKRVKVNTYGGEKVRIGLAACALGDGTPCRLYVNKFSS